MVDAITETTVSLPVRGVWIEINKNITGMGTRKKSLPVRGVWIEIDLKSHIYY